MKKLIVALFAAVLLTAGLVTAAGSPAQAASCPKANPYTGCVKVRIIHFHALHPQKRARHHHKAKVVFDIKAGGATPKGNLRWIVKRNGHVVKKVIKPYHKRIPYLTTPRLRPGRWVLNLTFVPAHGTPFTSDSATQRFTIKRR